MIHLFSLSCRLRSPWHMSLPLYSECPRHPLSTLATKAPLSLWIEGDNPKQGMISLSKASVPLEAFSIQHGKALTQPAKMATNTSRYLTSCGSWCNSKVYLPISCFFPSGLYRFDYWGWPSFRIVSILYYLLDGPLHLWASNKLL